MKEVESSRKISNGQSIEGDSVGLLARFFRLSVSGMLRGLSEWGSVEERFYIPQVSSITVSQNRCRQLLAYDTVLSACIKPT
jgi:hypothetical protein